MSNAEEQEEAENAAEIQAAQDFLAKVQHGRRLLLRVEEAHDVERIVFHGESATLVIDELGLEFQSARTAGKEMSLRLMLDLVLYDIRDNAMQISNAEEDAREKMIDFLEKLGGLCDTTGWEFRIECIKGESYIEGLEPELFELTQAEKLEQLGYQVVRQ